MADRQPLPAGFFRCAAAGVAAMYGLIGVIPGVLLGILGGHFAAQGLAAQSNTIIEEFGVSVTGIVLGVLVGLVGLLVIVTLASLWPSLAAARKTVSDILRYQ